MIPEEVRKTLEKQKYGLVGRHSAVKICNWTKNSLNGKGVCWKEKFYGVESHRCCQMSPAVMWCENQCLHCWRAIEMNLGMNLEKFDSAKEILDKTIEKRKELLEGFKGNPNVSEEKFNEALNPTLFTLSLSGEPTIYPLVGELIQEIRKRNAVSFLVTNGQNPEALRKLEKKDALPTQLTISMNAPNKELFEKWHRSLKKNSWEKFNESLDVLNDLKGKTRRAIRLTLVKGSLSNMKDVHVKEYAKLIKKASPDFVHVKAFMSVGFARQRLGYDTMPDFKEMEDFSERLAKEVDLKILGSHEYSRVFVLGKSKKDLKIKKV